MIGGRDLWADDGTLPTAPVAQEMLALVAELDVAEHAAEEQLLVGRAKLEFRKQRAGPIRARMRAWLAAHRERHPPKSPIPSPRRRGGTVEVSTDAPIPKPRRTIA